MWSSEFLVGNKSLIVVFRTHQNESEAKDHANDFQDFSGR